MTQFEHTGTMRETARLYWQANKRYKLLFGLAFLGAVAALFLTVLLPFFASKILAGIVQEDPNLSTYLWLFAASAVTGLTLGRIGFVSNMRMQARVMGDLNHKMFEHLLQRSTGFHANRISGKLVSDALDFVNSYSQLTAVLLVSVLPFTVTLVAGLTVVFINSWQMGAFISLIVAVILTWVMFNSRRRSRLRAKRLVATKKLTAHLSDSIVNAQTVKTFAQERLELERNKTYNERLRNLRLKDWSMAGHSGNNRMTVLIGLQFCLMLLVIHLARSNPVVLGAGIFAFTYTLTLMNRLFELDNITRHLEEAFLNASPMTGILQEQVEIQDKPGATELIVPKGGIELRDVSFAYPESAGDSTVFEHFNLHIRPGEKLGLVGPSGGGKSTLTRLLLRFDEIHDGAILIDDQDISVATQESVRRNIAYVPQEPLLFHRSIRENIAYGRPDATQEQVIEAAKQANAHDFILTLPAGYDTMVGERGVKLSGGQRQRVAIARAILKDAPILILDEATSALDSENETQVQEALWHLMQHRTTIVIAHRLSTIQKMDRIAVLQDGRIVEEGAHKTLLKHKGLYARLWKHQSGGFIED